ncbi:MAG: adenosine deaminase [Ignavibacteriales bacterium]|nr:adenosine deaminase [Ignavibacteriales bacterium]
MKSIEQYIRQMPKVELHVHLEGSVQPKTLLKLAERHHISLPAVTVEGIREWYTFRDFAHFVEIYMTISSCLRTVDDIELIAREFLLGQAEQNILHSEVTFTPYNQWVNCGLGFHEQLDAVNRAREWGEKELGIRMGMIIDIPRERAPEAGEQVSTWVIDRFGDGVVALGLGGPEQGNPPEKFRNAFNRMRDNGIPCVLHAGETDGPSSIWNAIEVAGPARIGHGVRAVEDPKLVEYLHRTQLPLEVCPTSNICLGVFPSLAEHCLPQLLDLGLRVSINSDDPPMFNTTLADEYLACAITYGWDKATLRELTKSAVDMLLLPSSEKLGLRKRFQEEFAASEPL